MGKSEGSKLIVGGRVLLSWHGTAVPWTTLWLGEEQPLFQRAGEHLLFTTVQAQQVGRPVFKSNHITRVYLSLTRRLCSVCGMPFSENEWAWCVPMDPPGEQHTPELAEPPAHEQCLRYACIQCPALVRRSPPVWGFRAWEVQKRLNLPPDLAQVVCSQIPVGMAGLILISETVYTVVGPVKHLTYPEFLG